MVCAVIVREERVLLCKRAAGRHLAGHWEFPGGKVEEGEEERAALAREIREELGCAVEPGAAIDPIEHSYPGVTICLLPFVCTIVDGEPAALEHEEIGWFTPVEVDSLMLAEADRFVWRRYRAAR